MSVEGTSEKTAVDICGQCEVTDCPDCPNYSETPEPDESGRSEMTPRRRAFQPTPFVDALVTAVQEHLGRNGRRQVSYAAALTWIIEDFAWCDTDKPAFGRMSPVMCGIVRDVLEAS